MQSADGISEGTQESKKRRVWRRSVIGMTLLVLFAAITLLVIYKITQQADAELALSINGAYLGNQLSLLMVTASEYGREYFWIPVVAIMLVFGKRDTKLLALELSVLFIIGIAAGEAMKYAMYRPRPGAELAGITMRVPLATDSSYPSGHALIVFIGAFFALVEFVKSRKARAAAAILLVEALLVSYSRIYVGAHYPLDVVAGVVLAGAITFIGLAALERYFQRPLNAVANFADTIAGKLHLPDVV